MTPYALQSESDTATPLPDPRRPRRPTVWSRLSRIVLGESGLQRMRAGQSLLAMAVFAIFAAVQAFEVAHGLMDRTEANALSCFNIAGSLIFFAVIRSGLNQRFASDPSLTFIQCLFGIVSIGVAYAITGPARGAVMGIALLILVFAMFALSPARIRILALFAFGTLATAMFWRSQTLPDRYPIDVEATHLMFALIIVASVAVLSVRMGEIRARLHRQKDDLKHALEQNRRLATLDELTGLANRRHMAVTLRAEAERVRRGADGMSVVLVDIDLFKRINDRHGHAAGDLVLKGFAELAVGNLRACDCMSRWGGEEFLVMMPGTGVAQAMVTMDRLRVAFAEMRWPTIDDALQATFSAGIAAFRVDEPIDATIERADQCMYAAKASGRNRVCEAPLDTETQAVEPVCRPAALAA